jgi:hypothetical protein
MESITTMMAQRITQMIFHVPIRMTMMKVIRNPHVRTDKTMTATDKPTTPKIQGVRVLKMTLSEIQTAMSATTDKMTTTTETQTTPMIQDAAVRMTTPKKILRVTME